ncbi:hypothetical protein DQ237_11235 [Blastococcus sp. TF02-8]|uniref:hypothetical protein n=1 Tax=Blastococcus sp. TF02-8 TaxID=2250574 RepID=UPI000DE975CE|nr:hypothetical protein [Blastococcus sp. TF02-8]RBY95734.1 hypothetical protein DQ237_11235 [Blastococcus sp. TF02-8]
MAGKEIAPDELPAAVRIAGEVAGRLREGLVMGVTFLVLLAAYLPRFLPPDDLFSWSLLGGAVLAVAIYAYGLLAALRARSWLRRHGPA